MTLFFFFKIQDYKITCIFKIQDYKITCIAFKLKHHLNSHKNFAQRSGTTFWVSGKALVLGSSAKRWCLFQEITYFVGSQSSTDGPCNLMNIKADTRSTSNFVRIGVMIKFIWLNPLSHSAVLHGMIFAQFNKGISSGRRKTECPLDPRAVDAWRLGLLLRWMAHGVWHCSYQALAGSKVCKDC